MRFKASACPRVAEHRMAPAAIQAAFNGILAAASLMGCPAARAQVTTAAPPAATGTPAPAASTPAVPPAAVPTAIVPPGAEPAVPGAPVAGPQAAAPATARSQAPTPPLATADQPFVPGSSAPPSAVPGGPTAPTAVPAPPGTVPADVAGAAPQAAAPDLSRSLADLDIGGLRESWSDTPSIIGDGCAPAATTSTVAVGRIVIIAPGLAGNGSALVGPFRASANALTNGSLNSVQAIQAAGYPSFVLPAQPLGDVPGTPPVTLPVGGASPGAGITPVQSPASYTATADTIFATSPELTTSQYANQNPQTVYDAAASGALPADAASKTSQDAFLFYDYLVQVESTAFVPGLNVGFTKLTENASPIPRDRVYFNYSYFHNANITAARADVNRFVPGFEKTFFDNWTSIEVRTPFAGTLSNSQQVSGLGGCGGISEYRDVEFGNMSVIFKSFLLQRDTWGISGGVQMLLPTADSVFVSGVNQLGQPVNFVYVENQSVHAMPFVGSVWAPTERWFNQFIFQVDVDTNGSPVYVNANQQSGISQQQMSSAGRVILPTLLYTSFSTGYWLYTSRGTGLTGFSPMMELHVNQGLTEFQPVEAYGYTLGNDAGSISVINGLVGCNFEWNRRSTATFAYVTPLGGGLDRFFDGELRAFVNWRFGRQNRLTRAQF